MYCNSKAWVFFNEFEDVINEFIMAAMRVLTSVNWQEITFGYI